MDKKIIKTLLGIGFFTAGVIFGKKIQKWSHEQKTLYAGTLQITDEGYNGDDQPIIGLYLALEVQPESLKEVSDVIFKVRKINHK